MQYLRDIVALVSSPNARGFLEQGGLAWRLALEFGGPTLWEDVFKGPSSLCVSLGRGKRSPDLAYISEEVSDNKYAILTGSVYETGLDGASKVLKVSLFPPLDPFEGSKHWIGVWTAYNESWFQGLLKSLLDCKLKPESFGTWKRNMRSNRSTLTEDDAKSYIAIVEHLILPNLNP
jgi:hypothetical protein